MFSIILKIQHYYRQRTQHTHSLCSDTSDLEEEDLDDDDDNHHDNLHHGEHDNDHHDQHDILCLEASGLEGE